MQRWSFVVAAVVSAALVAVVAGPSPAGAGPPPPTPHTGLEAGDGRHAVEYRPPLDAPVVDGFRPPATPYGPGNRGVDYATEEGQAVRAVAAGRIVFAGPVGGSHHVVVLHADGVRSSYSFLASAAVRRGEAVAPGQVLGAASAAGLHLGARAGDAYLDPLVLLGRRPGHARLVPDPDDAVPLSEAAERAGLVEALRHTARRITGAGRQAAAWLAARAERAIAERAELLAILASDAVSLGTPLVVRLAAAALAWEAEQEGCTPPATPAPPAAGRRQVLLVGGLGSSSERAAVFSVDTTALGYAPADVHRFSYRPDGGPYRPADTMGDIDAAAALLAAQVAELARARPGVPVDVVAHSMGGLVARAALLRHRPAGVATLVTLGSPHRGADLATVAAGLGATAQGRAVFDELARLPLPIQPGGTSVMQMAELSDFVRALPEDGWPPGVRVVSVAARTDAIVPSTRSHLRGAANVVVDLPRPGPFDHGHLPASAAATREIALARAGLGPSCRPLADRLVDAAVAQTVAGWADLTGAALAMAALAGDPLAAAGVTLPTAGGPAEPAPAEAVPGDPPREPATPAPSGRSGGGRAG